MHIDDPQGTFRKLLTDLRFWRPRFLPTDAPAEYLPTLAWLATLLEPREVVYLGVKQGAGYFALCQTLDNSGSLARLTGMDTWPENAANGALPDVPETLKTHNLANYAERSRLFLADTTAAPELVGEAALDMLVIEQELTPDVVEALRKDWLCRISPRGVVVLLNRQSAARHIEAEEGLIELTEAMPSVELPVSPGITLLFPGTEPSPLLSAIKAQSNDREASAFLMDYLALLGSRLAAMMASDQDQSELERLSAENRAFREALEDRDETSQKLISEIERLIGTVEALTLSRDRTMNQQAERIVELSIAENRLRDALAEQEEAHFATQSALDRSAARVQELVTSVSQLTEAAARQEQVLKGLQEEVSAAQAHVDELHASTSWRLTAPIRAVKRAFKLGKA